jgi:threonine dehydratase
MPRTTPVIKVEAVRRHGTKLALVGQDYSEAEATCARMVAESGMTLIHAYDDPEVIAGQATIALETMRQAPSNFASIFVPIGGGGLAAGIASVIKAVAPWIKVYGVEPDDSDAMTRSIRAGRRIALERVGSFADGVAVRVVGETTFALCRDYLDECITVSVDEICTAIKDVFVDTRAILEPAGALAIAGLKQLARSRGVPAGTAIAIASGANVDFDRLGSIAERSGLAASSRSTVARSAGSASPMQPKI